MGAHIIDLHGCGLNYFNCSSLCMDNIHPNINGAKLLAKKAVADIYANSRYSHPLRDPVQKFTLYCKHVDESGAEIRNTTSTSYPIGTEVTVPGESTVAGYKIKTISHSGTVTMNSDVTIIYTYELDGSAIAINLGTLKSNTWLNASGAESTLSNWYSTDYIAVNNSATAISGTFTGYNNGTNITAPITFYDSNKTLIEAYSTPTISGSRWANDIEVNIPANTAYIRLCWTIENYPHITTGTTVSLGSSPQFLWIV